MAQLTQDTLQDGRDDYGYTPERANFGLNYLTAEWSDLPNFQNEWDQWNIQERYIFYLEWSIRESWSQNLSKWHKAGLLSPEQCERYAELQRLIEQNTPILEQLFAA